MTKTPQIAPLAGMAALGARKSIMDIAAQIVSVGADKPAEDRHGVPSFLSRELNPGLNGGHNHVPAIAAAASRLKDKGIAKPKLGPKETQVAALRANRIDNTPLPPSPFNDPTPTKTKSPSLSAPAPLKLKWNNGTAVTRWAVFSIRDLEPDLRVLLVTTADGEKRIASHKEVAPLADAALIHAIKLRDNNAPQYKPSTTKAKKTATTREKESSMRTAPKSTQKATGASKAKKAPIPRRPAKKAAGAKASKSGARPVPAPKGESKGDKVTKMLKNGWTSMPDIMKATEWLPHSARAFISGLGKKGHKIEHKRDDNVAHYRIK